MNQFPELKVIPVLAWFVAACVGLGFLSWLLLAGYPNGPNMRTWPEAGRICFAVALPLILSGFALLIGYVYGDARRRGMRYVMWTWLSILIPNGIGIILYFLMRDPLPRVCPKCGTTVSSKGVFCPACGGAFANTCPACHCAVEPGWSHCTNCGTAIK